MRWFIDFIRSSIGTKMLMAVTGLALVAFAFAHMLGNLQIFLGPDAINGYAKSLRMVPALLWTARTGLILMVLLHIGAAVLLVLENRAARPVPYAKTSRIVTGYAARTMAYSGLIIVAFVAYHLAHFTLLWTNPEFRTLHDAVGRHNVYDMVVTGFQNKAIAALYIIAVGLLCMHLSHGIPSFFQSLGLRHGKYTPAVELIGPVAAVLLFVGYVSVPISVMAGWIKLSGAA
jgi:succinate dehydrogenase / fumarate reductase cytochrome b subunit